MAILPEPIRARDLDTLNNYVKYSFVEGTPPNYYDFFEIDDNTGIVSQRQAIDRKKFRQMRITIKVSHAIFHFKSEKIQFFVWVLIFSIQSEQ